MSTLRIGAYGVVNDGNGAILLVRLGELETEAGKWTLPGGGLEFGEEPRAAATREIKEETGLDAHVTEVVEIRSFVYERPEGAIHHIGVLYRIPSYKGEIKSEANGFTEEARWFSYHELAGIELTQIGQAGVDWLFRSTTYR